MTMHWQDTVENFKTVCDDLTERAHVIDGAVMAWNRDRIKVLDDVKASGLLSVAAVKADLPTLKLKARFPRKPEPAPAPADDGLDIPEHLRR